MFYCDVANQAGESSINFVNSQRILTDFVPCIDVQVISPGGGLFEYHQAVVPIC